ncbi:SusC/RagA family TonB-linked outer membrane protein [Pedobacter agri]|uniref:SusC/RagA family TonB-linked outer membrane protein n=1 Tax=Pedobacter agri TaxID=454586 RepID=UPI002931EF4A|nr:SusC/RagA family TonB-linked outer membrane protein [Pedobacter agri]
MKKSTIFIVGEPLCQNFYKPPAVDPEEKTLQNSESHYLKHYALACIRLELLQRRSVFQIMLICLALLYPFNLDAQIKYYPIQGIIKDKSGQAISNATIKLQGTSTFTSSDANGLFTLKSPQAKGTLEVRLVGYKTTTKDFDAGHAKELEIKLEEAQNALEEVTVLSTGYQNLNKDKATGSFTTIDSTLINRSVSTNILDRLDGVTSGLLFNRNKTQGGQSDINIRGRSTINGEDKPLIVVDNFPYEGELNNINPNDIKSITILKDAAAAAIWGTRAGNGVIVISTYKGNYQSSTAVNFTSNFTLAAKPDLFRLPWFSSSDWIASEKFLYDKGAYNSAISTGYAAISPAVEIFEQSRKKTITPADSLRLINALKGNDVRSEMLQHLYRPLFNQQYALNLRGGSAAQSYYLSAGFDNNAPVKTTDRYQRTTLTANNTFRLLKEKMEISTGILYTASTTESGIDSYSPLSPYDRLADAQGNPLAVRNGLRLSYLDTAGKGKLLDWKYRPLEENKTGGELKLSSIILNAGVNYKILSSLKASILYQYQLQSISSSANFDEDSYYTRNLVNSLSKIDNSTGAVQRPLPTGGIVQHADNRYHSDYLRLQFNYDKILNSVHNLYAIAGAELRDNQTQTLSQTLYGFNPSTEVNANAQLDFGRDNPVYYNPSITQRLEPGQRSGYVIDRYISYYANAGYSYQSKYVLSISARKDESNLFGVKPNQKGVPLWSAGLSWALSKEKFYDLKFMPEVKLRASFGYTGNVSKSITAFLTSSALGNNIYGAPQGYIVNPPNPSLRWEKVKIINLGLDFALFKNAFTGSIEPYAKYGSDLFGTTPLAGQVGILTFQGNFASTRTTGIDISLNAVQRFAGISWQSNFLLSTAKSIVTEYSAAASTNSNLIAQSYNTPIVGNPYFAIYAYNYAGLDDKGDPQVYFNGEKSKNYSAINNSIDRSNVRLMGSAVPTTFGSFRNSFSYKGFELSANLTYRLGYYFRRNSLDNALVYSTSGFQYSTDYEKRWQKAGDENTTNVPALLYPNSAPRNTVYRSSDILIEKGDNIKLQDIRLSWNSKTAKGPNKIFSELQLYTYISNLGYLWRANTLGIDPDNQATVISNLPQPRTFAFGLKMSL